jgi:hypothetical protein
MTAMPTMTLVDVTLLSGSNMRAVGTSSLMLMYVCTQNVVGGDCHVGSGFCAILKWHFLLGQLC